MLKNRPLEARPNAALVQTVYAGSPDTYEHPRVEVERDAAHPLMSGFHGIFSIGGSLGGRSDDAAVADRGRSACLHTLDSTLIAVSVIIACPACSDRPCRRTNNDVSRADDVDALL